MKTASPLLGQGGCSPFAAFLAPALAQKATARFSYFSMWRCFFISSLQEAAQLEGRFFSVESFLNGYLLFFKNVRGSISCFRCFLQFWPRSQKYVGKLGKIWQKIGLLWEMFVKKCHLKWGPFRRGSKTSTIPQNYFEFSHFTWDDFQIGPEGRGQETYLSEPNAYWTTDNSY